MPYPAPEVLNGLVARVFRVDDVTLGEPARGLIARYRGHLISEDSAAAYDQLAESLKPYDITTLFRREKEQHVIYLTPSKPDPKPTRISVNIILFVLTLLSVLFTGSLMAPNPPSEHSNLFLYFLSNIGVAWPFAASLLGILLAHEFGHYFMSRHHKTPATLPYFIPLPFSPLGTMGAAILMRGTPKNKRVLFDIGVAGPLAGLVVAIPVLFYGLATSNLAINQAPPPGMELILQGNSLFYLLAKYLVFGKLLPVPAIAGGVSPVLYWLRFFFTGLPSSMGAMDVNTNPIAFAGWAGLLVTSLNLIPAGTLDGGHAVYALFGDKAAKAFPYIFGALILLGVFWNGWWIWAFLLIWLGRVHAEPLDQITGLDKNRRLLAGLVILIFIVTFSPVPFLG